MHKYRTKGASPTARVVLVLQIWSWLSWKLEATVVVVRREPLVVILSVKERRERERMREAGHEQT